MKRFILIFISACCLLTDCSTAKAQSLSATNGLFPHYNISIKIIPETHHLEAAGTMRIPAAKRVREKLILALSEMAVDLRIEVQQPALSVGVVRVEKTERPGGTAGLRRWTIIPSSPIPAGETILLKFSYAINNGLDSIFYVGPEGSFGSGLNTAWYPEMEDENQFRLRGTGTLQFIVPAGYTAYTTGIRLSAPEQSAQGDFRFRIDRPVFFSFGVGKYTVSRSSDQPPVAVYLLRPRPREKIEKLIQGAVKVIKALAQEFGTFPYPEYGIVEMPTKQARQGGSDGASLDGFMLGISSYFDQEFNTAFYAHEIAHLWWGNIIQKKGSRGSYMIDEAMAQYGSLRAVETIEGTAAAEKYRRTGYPGYYSEYSGFAYLARSLAGLDNQLSDLPISDGFLSRRVANTKGMLVWDLLSRTIGRERFSRILKDFILRKSSQRVTWEEFLQAVEDGAGRNLKWFYTQWFERTGVPDWQLNWKQEGKNLRGTITQSIPYYQASIELEATDGDCRHATHKVEIRGARTEFVLPVDFKVKIVVLDPHFLTIRWTPEYRAEATELLSFTKADLKLSQGQIAEAYEEFKTALSQAPKQDRYGLRFLLEYGIAQALIEQNKFAEAKEHIQAAMASPVRRVDILPWVYVQLATVAKKLNDTTTLNWAANAVVLADAAAGGRTGAVEQINSLLDDKNNDR